MRAARLVIMASVVLACGGGPAPTPQIIYVTPAPTVAGNTVAPTEKPTPTPRPTPVSDPTFTEDDQRVDQFIRNGFTELTGYIGDISTAAHLPVIVDAYRDLG